MHSYTIPNTIHISISTVRLARRKAMFEVTGYLVLYLLAVEGAITGQSKAHDVPKEACCHHNNAANQHEVSDSQRLGIVTRDENRIDGHLTAVVNNSNVDNATTCPTWFYPRTLSNGSTECECGSDLGKMVTCNSTSHVVGLLHCYCMTYNNDKSGLVVGASYYGCYHTSHDICSNGPRYELPFNSSSLNKQCEKYNRDGQLCGQCRKGFAPLVYSYDMSCMNCTNPANNWLKYITAAFLPLTVFFVIVISCRIRATSVLMNTFILFSQTVTAPSIMRSLITSPSIGRKWLASRIILSFYGIWNLDFFRLLHSHFCLHPQMTMVQVIALDYAIAVYPLVLIATTYLLVELHDHDFRVIVWLWKPFHRCFVRFRRGWNIKTSLIDAFATFLLLSYVKFLSVSFDLLVPTIVFNIHGKRIGPHLYYDGSVKYFGKEHLPYGILALVVLIVFNILPLLLLCVYPCRCFQRCLNRCRLRYQLLHTFMDAFQGHFKDGTNGTRDCRWFSALYLIVRLLFLASLSTVYRYIFWLPIGASITLVLLLLTAILRPYKSPTHNNLDIFLLATILFVCVGVMAQEISLALLQFLGLSNFILVISLIIPFAYMVVILLYKLCSSIRCVRVTCQRIQASIPCHCREEGEPDDEETLPYRMVTAEEYAPLLGEAPALQDYNSSGAVVEQSNELDSETHSSY